MFPSLSLSTLNWGGQALSLNLALVSWARLAGYQTPRMFLQHWNLVSLLRVNGDESFKSHLWGLER